MTECIAAPSKPEERRVMTKKVYAKPRLKKLGLLRLITAFSF